LLDGSFQRPDLVRLNNETSVPTHSYEFSLVLGFKRLGKLVIEPVIFSRAFLQFASIQTGDL